MAKREGVGLLRRIRFLPMTIGIAAVMLTVKIGNIWDGVEKAFTSTQFIAAAKAQQAPATPPAAPRAQPGSVPGPAATAPTAAAPRTAAPGAPPPAAPTAAGQAATGAAIPGAPAKPAEPARAMTDDPTLLTQAEIDLLQQLAERRDALDARQRELDQRTGMLAAAETRIDRKVAELQRLQKTIEDLVRTYQRQKDAQVESLVKIYENMKPKDAARIFEQLDMDTLLMVAERMKERKLAPVLSVINPAKARDITEKLAQSRRLPTG